MSDEPVTGAKSLFGFQRSGAEGKALRGEPSSPCGDQPATFAPEVLGGRDA